MKFTFDDLVIFGRASLESPGTSAFFRVGSCIAPFHPYNFNSLAYPRFFTPVAHHTPAYIPLTHTHTHIAKFCQTPVWSSERFPLAFLMAVSGIFSFFFCSLNFPLVLCALFWSLLIPLFFCVPDYSLHLILFAGLFDFLVFDLCLSHCLQPYITPSLSTALFLLLCFTINLSNRWLDTQIKNTKTWNTESLLPGKANNGV